MRSSLSNGSVPRLAAAVIGGVALLPAIAGAAPVNRSGAITKFDAVSEIVEACRTSSSYVNMPSMTRTFTQGGTGQASVLVTFEASASISGQPFDTGFVRLQIDGATQAPGDIPLLGVDERGTHGFTWATQPLGAGSHTARIQMRTDLGSSFCVDARSLTVSHR
jgi:hypothetical protein